MGKSLTKEQQYMLVGIVCLLAVLYGYWTYLLRPTMDKIKKNKDAYVDLQQQIEKAERQARRLPALRNQLEQLQEELAVLEKQLPKDEDMPNIIRTITREALRENLEFSQVAPGARKNQQYFETIPFQLNMSGSLHALARFLASLGQQERIYKAGNLSLSPRGSTDQGRVSLTINIQIETYTYHG